MALCDLLIDSYRGRPPPYIRQQMPRTSEKDTSDAVTAAYTEKFLGVGLGKPTHSQVQSLTVPKKQELERAGGRFRILIDRNK